MCRDRVEVRLSIHRHFGDSAETCQPDLPGLYAGIGASHRATPFRSMTPSRWSRDLMIARLRPLSKCSA